MWREIVCLCFRLDSSFDRMVIFKLSSLFNGCICIGKNKGRKSIFKSFCIYKLHLFMITSPFYIWLLRLSPLHLLGITYRSWIKSSRFAKKEYLFLKFHHQHHHFNWRTSITEHCPFPIDPTSSSSSSCSLAGNNLHLSRTHGLNQLFLKYKQVKMFARTFTICFDLSFLICYTQATSYTWP